MRKRPKAYGLSSSLFFVWLGVSLVSAMSLLSYTNTKAIIFCAMVGASYLVCYYLSSSTTKRSIAMSEDIKGTVDTLTAIPKKNES